MSVRPSPLISIGSHFCVSTKSITYGVTIGDRVAVHVVFPGVKFERKLYTTACPFSLVTRARSPLPSRLKSSDFQRHACRSARPVKNDDTATQFQVPSPFDRIV